MKGIKYICVTQRLRAYEQRLLKLAEEENEVEFNNVLNDLDAGVTKILLKQLAPKMNKLRYHCLDLNHRVYLNRFMNILYNKYYTLFEKKDHSCPKLTKACLKGDLELVKTLVSLKQGSKDEENYAMREACKGGHLDVLKYLIENGISTFETIDDYELRIPSYRETNYRNIIQYVIENTGRYEAAINYALESDNYDMVRWIVEDSRNKEDDKSREEIKITEEFLEIHSYLQDSTCKDDREMYNYLKSKVTQ